MLTLEAQDPQGIAAEHQSAVKQALIKMLEDEELAKVQAFKNQLYEMQRHQHLQEQQARHMQKQVMQQFGHPPH
jgi:hypothetical protein